MAKHFVEAEELQAYLDWELGPGRQAEVERHLVECRECAALVSDLKRVSATLQRWEVEPAPANLRPPAVEEASPKRGWLGGHFRLALAGTALVGLITVGIVLPRWRVSPIDKAEEPAFMEVVPRKTGPPTADTLAQAPPVSEPPVMAYQSKPKLKVEKRNDRKRALVRRVPREAEAAPAASPPARLVEELSRQQARADAPTEGYELRDSASAVAGLVENKAVNEKDLAKKVDALAPSPLTMERRAVTNRSIAQARGMVASRVSMTVEVKEFDTAKESLQRITSEAGGYVTRASSNEIPDRPRRAEMTLRVPAEKLDAVLEQVRALGRVAHEELFTDDLAEQFVDLEARLRNSRATETRLLAVLDKRTGKVGDVLEVEREIAHTRTEIERMEAQRQNLLTRVELATVRVTLTEEYQAQLKPAPVGTGTRLRNALVEGYESFVGLLLGFVFFFARYGLHLLFWLGLGWLGWVAVRKRLPLALPGRMT